MPIARSVAECIEYIHSEEVNLVHGDIKQRNIVKMGDRWKLIDFDASTRTGQLRQEKYSEAFISPEQQEEFLPTRKPSVTLILSPPTLTKS